MRTELLRLSRARRHGRGGNSYALLATAKGPILYGSWFDHDRASLCVSYPLPTPNAYLRKWLGPARDSEMPSPYMLPVHSTSDVRHEQLDVNSLLVFPSSGDWWFGSQDDRLLLDNWFECLVVSTPAAGRQSFTDEQRQLVWNDRERKLQLCRNLGYRPSPHSEKWPRFSDVTSPLPFLAGNTPFGCWCMDEKTLSFRAKDGTSVSSSGDLAGVVGQVSQLGVCRFGDVVLNTAVSWANNRVGIGVSTRKLVVASLPFAKATQAAESVRVSIFETGNGRVELSTTMSIPIPKYTQSMELSGWRKMIACVSEDSSTCWIGIGVNYEDGFAYSIIHLDLE